MLVLKKDIIDKVRKDPKLFGRIAEELDTTVSYGLRLLNENNPKLTQAGVLRILREGLSITDEDILEETDNNSNTNISLMQEVH